MVVESEREVRVVWDSLLAPSERSVARAVGSFAASRAGSVPSLGRGTRPKEEVGLGLLALCLNRPCTGPALLHALIEQGSATTHGRRIARSMARWLGVSPSQLDTGQYYARRVRPLLHLLQDLGVIVPALGSRPARGRPACFRLVEAHRGELLGVLALVREGRGFPWDADPWLGVAEHCGREIAWFNWDRQFARGRRAGLRGLSCLRRAGASPRTRFARILLQAQIQRELADAALHLGDRPSFGRAVRAARRGFALCRRLKPPALAPAFGLAQTLLMEAEHVFGDRRRVEAVHRTIEAIRLYEWVAARNGADWEVRRNIGVAWRILGQIQGRHGDTVAALRASLTSATLLSHLAADPRVPEDARIRANLALNRATSLELLAQCLGALGEERRAQSVEREAVAWAGVAARVGGSGNPVIQRHLGALLATRLRTRDPSRLSAPSVTLRARAEKALRLAIAVKWDRQLRRDALRLLQSLPGAGR